MSTLPCPLPFPRLQIARLEGRGRSTLFKQAQFRRLYKALTTSASAIRLAIQQDSGHQPHEVEFEFTLAISELRNLFDSLDLAQELDSLRRVTKGQDNVDRTKPVGIVYIVPSSWSLFYSVISALGAALAAGSCVILELPQTLGHVSPLLRKLLTESLDGDIFAISTSRPAAKEFTSQCTLVLQEASDIDQSRWSQLIRPPQHSGTIVVVDRTGDVVKTAEIIATAGFAFRGKSPYSPRVVLVNEYIADQLLSALAAHVTDSRLGTEKGLNGNTEPPYLRRQKSGAVPKKANIKEIVSGSNGSIVELLDRFDVALLKESEGPTIFVSRVSSFEDAIGSVSEFETFAACFAFGGVSEANYISTYIDAHLSTINHIPTQLLIGPVAPAHPSKSATPSPRYSPSLFTLPSPQYLLSHSRPPLSILSQKNQNSPELKELTDAVMKPLPEDNKPTRFLLNFFGTGIMIGLSTVGLTLVGTTTGMGWFLYKTYRARY